jgi:hypothetical protein
MAAVNISFICYDFGFFFQIIFEGNNTDVFFLTLRISVYDCCQ